MIYSFGMGFSVLWALHVLSVIAFFTGVLFFIVLAIKTFTAKQLRTWALWLVIGGAVLCLATIAVMGHPWAGMNKEDRVEKMQEFMLQNSRGSMKQLNASSRSR